MEQNIAECINILGRFCGPRDVAELTRSQLQRRYGLEQADVMALFGGSILCGGDVLGLVLFVSAEDRLPGEGEYKLAQAVAGFLGKHMEA